jgi:hypothetical protein
MDDFEQVPHPINAIVWPVVDIVARVWLLQLGESIRLRRRIVVGIKILIGV